MARNFALIAPVQPVLHRVSCSYEMIPNAPKHYETHQNMSFGSNGTVWVHSLRKIPTWLRARTFALIAPVHTILHRVSCSYETILNAPKYYKTDWNISLGSNGVDWVHLLRKIPTQPCGMNFCTYSACFAPSFVWQPNDPQCTQIEQNAPKHQFRVQWGGLRSLRKILTLLRGTNFCTSSCTSSAHFAPSSVRQPNGPECTQIVWNTPKH